MRFERIKLYGFKDENRIVDVKFSYSPVSIIYGKNGCGKTSFLRVLSAILVKDEDVLINENIKKIEIEISNDSEIYNIEINKIDIEGEYVKYENLKKIIESDIKTKAINLEKSINIKMDIEKFLNKDLKVNRYDWSQYDKSVIINSSSILFGVNRGISSNLQVSSQEIEDYFLTVGRSYRNYEISEIKKMSRELSTYLNRNKSNTRFYSRRRRVNEIDKKHSVLDKLDMDTIEEIIFNRYKLANMKKIERVQNALFETLSCAIYSDEEMMDQNIPEDFFKNLSSNKDKLLEILNKCSENRLQKDFIKILKTTDNSKIVDECKKNKLLLNLLVKMIEQLNEEESILQSINTLEEVFNSQILDNKKLVVDDSGVIIKFENEENNHKINKLSSGEKHLLSFLTIFLIEGKERDILMIDEPELSLNIDWQRKILNILEKLAPNSQIIVASHSPIIARKVNSLVELL